MYLQACLIAFQLIKEGVEVFILLLQVVLQVPGEASRLHYFFLSSTRCPAGPPKPAATSAASESLITHTHTFRP